MSDQNDSVVESQTSQAESKPEAKEQYVAKKAYEEVSRDMHKYKSQAKEVAALKNELEAKLKSIEESKLMDEKRWQELYEKEKEEKESLNSARQKDLDMYLRSAKKSALKQELGGKVKDVYLNHASIDEIEIGDDGTLSSESVLQVANKFRNEFPEVIPSSDNLNITGNASPTQIANEELSFEERLKKMTTEEKGRFLQELKNK